LHEKFAAKFADFSGVGGVNPRIRIKEITRINKKNSLLFLTKLLDEGPPPGQTAKQEIFSAAGLDFALDIGRESQGEGFSRVGGRCLRPSGNGEQEDEESYSQSFAQKSLLKIIDTFVPSHQKRVSRVSSTERTPTISISPKSPVTRL
jgi:hypothetical protein